MGKSEKISIFDIAPEVVRCGDFEFAHNSREWVVATNAAYSYRHDVGIVSGPANSIYWSDDSDFNRKEAEKFVSIHNEWLKKQTPISLEIQEEKIVLERANRNVKSAADDLEAAESDRDASISRLSKLQTEQFQTSFAEGLKPSTEIQEKLNTIHKQFGGVK